MRKGSGNSKVDYKCDCGGDFFFIYGVLTSYFLPPKASQLLALRFRYTKKWINGKLGLPTGWHILNIYNEQVNDLNYPQIQGDMIVLLLG